MILSDRRLTIKDIVEVFLYHSVPIKQAYGEKTHGFCTMILHHDFAPTHTEAIFFY